MSGFIFKGKAEDYKKKNRNKGFTLIELIVVILIISIVAVSLAPQVVKYVNQSRVATDQNNAATIKSAVSTAYADYLSQGGAIQSQNGTFTINGKTPVDYMNIDEILQSKITEIMGGDWPASKYDTKGFRVSIDTKGKVEVAYGAYTLAKERNF